MDRRTVKTELTVGAFVLLALAALMFLIFKTGDLDFTSARGYELTTSLGNASGLTKGNPVTVAGVMVGEVREVVLERGRATVRIVRYPGNDIPQGTTSQLASRGLIGEKYVQLNPGRAESPPIEPGGRIPEAEGTADLEQVLGTANDFITDLREVSRSLRAVLGGPEGEASLRAIVENIEGISDKVNASLEENDQKITKIVENLERLTYALAEISEENRAALRGTVDNAEAVTAALRDQLPELLANMRSISGDLREVVGGNRENMDETLQNLRAATEKLDSSLSSVDSIAKKIDSGEGTIGKLVSDKETGERFDSILAQIEDFIGARDRFKTTFYAVGEYIGGVDKAKTRVGIRLQPRRERTYTFEVVKSPIDVVDIDRRINPDGTITTSGSLKDDKIVFTVLFGHRWRDLGVRAGLIETTAGAGLDYFFLEDDFRLYTDVWDFDSDQETLHGGNQLRPKLRVGLEYTLLENFTLAAGGYDLLNDRQKLNDAGRTYYLGLGFQFTDDDLRDLILQIPAPF
ncbi:MAG: MlaD family protein [Candidatus Methylomirabilis sp.]|nr:MlaD family protein [Deltaproteobacteria bacterium]